jgi:hypothetical protein
MDARLARFAVLAAVIGSLGASYRTPNFVVTTSSNEAAQQIGRAAEKFRRDLAIEWLGQEMPNWSQPCPVTVQIGEHLGAGGATSFVFEHGEVFGWRMTIQGSLERVLDSVLPHEVTHTVFATHFRQPLPRWADEGACTTVEHFSERAKQQAMLVEFLRTGRGIAFSRMFAMKEYPHDVMPLYSQGYSVARYLVAQGGRGKFLDFVADGLRDENWARATQKFYGINGLSDLQNQWLSWVRQGSPAIDSPQQGPALVAVKNPASPAQRTRPEANLIHRQGEVATAAPERDAVAGASRPSVYELASATKESPASDRSDSQGWRSRSQSADTQPADDRDSSDREHAADTQREPQTAESVQVTRPQPVQRPGQVILEWSRPQIAADGATAVTSTSGGTTLR